MERLTNILMYAGMIVMVLSCTGSKSSQKDSAGSEALYMYRWELTELQGEMVKRSEKFDPHLLFYLGDPGNLKGSAGCNQLSGYFVLSASNGISLDAAVTTRMACMQAEVEYEVIEALKKSTKWSVSEGRLLLSDGKRTLLELTAVNQPGG